MKMNFFNVILVVFILAHSRVCAGENKPVPVALPSGIEVFVAGKKFTSFQSYERKKEKDALDASEALKVPFDPLMGKTVIVKPGSTMVSSQTTLDRIKTIHVVPRGRVAGVEPSFKQMEADFDAGKAGNGVEPQTISSSLKLEEDLRRKLRAHNRPVLLIADKTKVRVMELQEKPTDPASP